MSNLTLFQQSGLPAHIRRTNDSRSLAADLPRGSFKSLSLKSQRFTIKEGGEPIADKAYVRAAGPIPVVLLMHAPKPQRVFYADDYVEGADEGPDCSSDNGVTPRGDAPAPQADACEHCPQNVWGSRISNKGKQARACGERRNLIVAIADSKLTTENPMIVRFSVPGGSLKSLGKFAQDLANNGVSYTSVICELSFGDDQTVVFDAVDFVTPEEQDAIDNILATRGVELEQLLTFEETASAAAEDDEAKPVTVRPPRRQAAPVEAAEAPAPRGRAAPAEAPAPAPTRRGRTAPAETAEAAPTRRGRAAPAPVEQAEAPAPAPTRRGRAAPAETAPAPTRRGRAAPAEANVRTLRQPPAEAPVDEAALEDDAFDENVNAMLGDIGDDWC